MPVPAIISTVLFEQAHARLQHNQHWAARNTRGAYLLRRLVSCRRCGLAHLVYNNGHYAYYRCKGMDTLIVRHRAEACHARQLETTRLDALVWADLCQVLTDPAILQEALRRAQSGWLNGDERSARQQDLHRRQHEVQRQIARLIDAYTADVLTLEELRLRRSKLEERAAGLRREEQLLNVEAACGEQLQALAVSIDTFRAKVAQRLDEADFATKRALVELLVDRVIVDAPEVEIRYVVPLSGAAQKKDVLRSHHRLGFVRDS